MARILLNRLTNQLSPYPRQDDEPVVGLDRNTAYVLEVMREPEPEYDSAAHYLQPLQPIITITDPNSDDVNGAVTYGWKLVEIPDTIAPDWARFKRIAMLSDSLKAITAAALQAEPTSALGLATALERCERGDIAEFADAWGAIAKTVDVPPEVIAGFVGVAQACNLPSEFVAALNPT